MTLRLTRTIAVPPGARPGFDHADVYAGGSTSRMYVAHTGADRIDVFDCASGTYIHALDDHPGVAGILIDSERDLLLATDRAASRLSVYRASDETLLGRVVVGRRPNGVALDTHQRRAFTFDLGDPPGEGCTMTVVDLDRCAAIAQRPLPGRPRWAAYDQRSRVVYANISAPASIVVVDSATSEVVRSIPVPAEGPHGLAVVGELLVCAADGRELVVIDPAGEVRARLPLAGVPDVVMFDRDLVRAYVAIGTPGVVQSFDMRDLRHVETVETAPDAHTIGWDPERKRLWAFAPSVCAALVFAESS